MYQKSIDDPDRFWSEVAEDFHWYSKWEQVRRYNYDRRRDQFRLNGSREQRPMSVTTVWIGTSRHERIKLRSSGKGMNRERMPRFPTDNCISMYLNLPIS